MYIEGHNFATLLWTLFLRKMFYHDETVDHGTHVSGTVAQSSAESEYNASCTAGMVLAHFRMLIHELLNIYPDIVP